MKNQLTEDRYPPGNRWSSHGGPRIAGSANHEHGESHRRAYQREAAPCPGARVECVIADTCIAGMAESAACEEKFSSQNVGVTITVTLLVLRQ